MDTKIKRDIEQILQGSVSPEEAQRLLARISDDDLERHIPKEELESLLTAYRQRNHFHHEPVPACSESEKDELWQRIKAQSAKAEEKNKWIETIKSQFQQFLMVKKESRQRLAFAFVSILILVSVPSVIYQYNSQEKSIYTGMKGTRETFGSIHYALIDSTNTLSRPDRPLTENDTLAFRLTVQQKGYFSLYIMCQNSTDALFVDTYFDEGVHDLKIVYHLTGNSGENSLALLSGSVPVDHSETDILPLIRDAEKNNMPSLDIDNTPFNLSYQKFMVRK